MEELDSAVEIGSLGISDVPPRMLSPRNQLIRVILYNRTRLDCPFFGSPIPTLRWFKNGQGSNLDGGNYHVYENGSLEIKMIRKEDQGIYTCVATNILGKAENQVRLEVKDPTRIYRMPEDQVAKRGTTVQLECRVKHDPSLKLTVSWLKDDEPLYIGNRMKKEDDSLTIFGVAERDQGSYTCVASTELDQDLAKAYLTVLAAREAVAQDSSEGNACSRVDRVRELPVSEQAVLDRTPLTLDNQLTWITRLTFTADQATPTNRLAALPKAPTVWSLEKEATLGKGLLGSSVLLPINETPRPSLHLLPGLVPFLCCPHSSTHLPCSQPKPLLGSHPLRALVHRIEDNDGRPDRPRDLELTDLAERSVRLTWIPGDDNNSPITGSSGAPPSKAGKEECTEALVSLPVPWEEFSLCLCVSEIMQISGSQGRSAFKEERCYLSSRNSSVFLAHSDYVVQFEEDQFQPGVWHDHSKYPGSVNSAVLRLSPYVNYQFRVIAVNEVGSSHPSLPSERYRTSGAPPESNPGDVKGEGTRKNNMEITWTPMNATSAFGPNLRYIVKWRRRETREAWNNVTVWGSRYVVGQTPVYVPYEIRVQAENDFGKGPEPESIIGYSGEDCE
ncbi:hypothetical protein P7K49_035779 [Saguinus oedipus]|uniref:Uncharacterized protein n=1 Tax=Saguinus oedipus TaxID=9490 RepID=A0ABQ9TNM1_SAGOE|nr:hypothetical protein P7K49_035779 [Saguinus oedipus]